MGDVIEKVKVRSVKQAETMVYFDSGSPFTFISKKAAEKLRGVLPLAKPVPFGGLGNGSFKSKAVQHLEFSLLGIWCKHVAYVVDEDITGEESDILAGHDLMQKYDIKLDLKGKKIILNKASLKRSQVVR